MHILKYIVLALIALALPTTSLALDKKCGALLKRERSQSKKTVSFSQEKLDRLNDQFAKMIFHDNEGNAFQVDKLQLNSIREMNFAFNIRYLQSPEEIIYTSRPFEAWGEAHISAAGDIDFARTLWKLPPTLRGLGLIKKPLQWWLLKMPMQASLKINDSSEMDYLNPHHSIKIREAIKEEMEIDDLLVELWELYEMAHDEQHPAANTPPSDEGFLYYIYDMFSLWGSMVRPAGYRSYYFREDINQDVHMEFNKGKYSAELLAAEADFAQSHGTRVIRKINYLMNRRSGR